MTHIGRFSQYRTAPIQSKMRDQFSRNRFPHSLLADSPAADKAGEVNALLAQKRETHPLDVISVQETFGRAFPGPSPAVSNLASPAPFPHSLLSDAPQTAADTPVVCLLPATGEPITVQP